MKFHWYWPFAREEELEWAIATARPGDSVLVEVIDRDAAPTAGQHGEVTVVRDLPDVNRATNPLTWFPSRASTYVRRAARRRSTWASSHFDLVHLHYLNRFTDAFSALPTPLVMSVHDVTPHRNRLGAAEHHLLHRTYRRADGIVVHHEVLRERLVAEFDIDPGRIHIVHHQVFWTPDVPPPPVDQPPLLLFFGALRSNKGLSVLLNAMQFLGPNEVRLVIAGRGDPAEEELARRAAQADPRVSAEIGFASLQRKRELFAEASLSVLPYTSFASQSGVLHDAYGHGRPVVVTDVGALGRTVRSEGTGTVANPNDPTSLAEAIQSALNPAQWQTFALAAQKIRTERSPQETGRRLRAVYDLVLSQG